MHGACLDALKAAYARVEMHVRVSGVHAEPFVSGQAVKQGCPLSPDLNGIFGEAFAVYVAAKDAADPAGMHAAECPVLTGGLPLTLLLYADDLSLFAYSRARLEALLRALREWCEPFGMRVNAKKCEALVNSNVRARAKGKCGRPTARRSVRTTGATSERSASSNAVVLLGFEPRSPALQTVVLPLNYRTSNVSKAVEMGIFARESGKFVAKAIDAIGMGKGKEFGWRKRARYLGLHYRPDVAFAEQPELVMAGKKVMLALLSKLRRQALLFPRAALRCFEVQVRSVLSYGAQLWGPAAVIAVLAGGEHAGGGLSGCFERALQHPACSCRVSVGAGGRSFLS